jgi:NADH dehydrogenase
MNGRPRVAIIGAGFAGVSAVRALAKAPVDVNLVDRNNYHTFFPLLYQIGAAELEPEEIAYPVRKFLHKYPNVRFLMDEVQQIDLPNRVLNCRGQGVPYDYLILASGSVPFYFGILGAARNALALKTMEDGIALRNHILSCFEGAVHESDSTKRRRWLTFTVVGGGPTEVEFTGALAELINGPLVKDYPTLNMEEVSLVLVEAGERLLGAMPQKLSNYASDRLARKGVDVRLGSVVSEISDGAAHLKNGEVISTKTVIWTAGVRASRLAESSSLVVNEEGQVKVGPTLEVPGIPGLYAAGDSAVVAEYETSLPMIAPVAMQQGKTAAKNILRQISGEEPQVFQYKDRGMLAVVGRNSAVGHIGKVNVTGLTAWLIWAGVHILGVIGFRNRLQVLINWASTYIFSERPVRLIIPSEFASGSTEVPTKGHSGKEGCTEASQLR